MDLNSTDASTAEKMHRSHFIRSIVLDLLLTILFCGLWNIVVQYSQLKALNYLLKEEKYGIWKISIFTLLTCGVYFIYYEYKKAQELDRITGVADGSDPILALLLSVFGFCWVYDAVFQAKLNQYLLKTSLPPYTESV